MKKNKKLTLKREGLSVVNGSLWHRTTGRCHENWTATGCYACDPYTLEATNCFGCENSWGC